MTIEGMMVAKEGENIEFKAAETQFSYTDLPQNASAISNESGEKIVFAITNKSCALVPWQETARIDKRIVK